METYRKAPQKKSAQTQKSSGAKKKTAGRLSPEELKKREARKLYEERRREEKRRQALLRKKRRKQLFRVSFALSLVFVLLYWAFVAVSIATRVKAGEEVLPLMVFTEGKRKEDKTYKPEELLFAGKKYLSVKELSPYMTVSQFGDGKTRSFQLENGEWATFHLGSEEAVVNGVHVSLSAPATVVEEDLYLPVDFYGAKMTLFDYSSAVPTYGADVLTAKDVEPGFYFHPSPQSAPVGFETVPVAPTLPVEGAESAPTA